jgi:hypothetical protein
MSNIENNILGVKIIKGIKYGLEKMILTIFDENRGPFYLGRCIWMGY